MWRNTILPTIHGITCIRFSLSSFIHHPSSTAPQLERRTWAIMTTTTLPPQSKIYGKSNVTISYLLHNFIAQFHCGCYSNSKKRKMLWDLGCNAGTFRKTLQIRIIPAVFQRLEIHKTILSSVALHARLLMLHITTSDQQFHYYSTMLYWLESDHSGLIMTRF